MIENNFVLYVHITPSNKKYFGITCKEVKHRWGSNGNGYCGNKHFWNAINKYAWDNIHHIILLDNLCKEWAITLEKLCIIQYKTYKSKYGYNRALGGDYGGSGYHYHHTEEFRQHLSKLKKGVPLTEEHKQGLKEGWKHRKQVGKGTPWNKGLALRQTGMIDNFIAAGRKNAEKERRSIYQLDLQGNIIQEYESVTAAARGVNANNRTGIFAVANGRQKTAHGYKWKYKGGN